jgi:tetratricopeptide (TPR) repeat protein
MKKNAREAGRLTEGQVQDKDAEITRLNEQLRKLQSAIAIRASEPGEQELSSLIAAGNFDEAVRLKSAQVEARRGDVDELARDLFELGNLHDLRFDWPNALIAYREAWQLKKDPEYGLAYGCFADKQDQFAETIAVFETLHSSFTDVPELTTAFNHLDISYTCTQSMKLAANANEEVISRRRQVAKTDPDGFLLYVSTILNCLAKLYFRIRRSKLAEEAFGKALFIRRELAKAHPDFYLSSVLVTLNNMALLYEKTQRINLAETTH